MELRRLGRTALDVPAIGLGCVELGIEYGAPGSTMPPPDEDAAVRFVQNALELGVTLLDTAPAYGRSETIVGRAIAGQRDRAILVTKVEVPVDGDGPAVARHVDESVRRSLAALRTDHVDVLLLHSPPANQLRDPFAVEAVRQQQELGRTRFVGASTYGAETAAAAVAGALHDVVQVELSPLDRRLVGTIGQALKAGVGVIARSVLLKGVLTSRAHALPDSLGPLRDAALELARLAADASLTLPELAYRFVLGSTDVSTALVGTSSLAELQSVVAAVDRGPLPAPLVTALERIEIADRRLLDPRTWPAG